MEKPRFKWKVVVSFGLTLSLVIMLLSGVVLFVSPPGRVANWSGWRMLGLSKSEWQEQHIIFGLIFGVLGIFHLCFFNWKLFFSYLKSRTSKGLQSPAELSVVLAATTLFAIGTLHQWQPFSGIVDYGRRISGSWEKESRSAQPPVPHAELLTLDELAALPRINSTSEKLLNTLKEAGVKVRDSKQTLQQIAAANGMEAMQIFAIMMPEGTVKTQFSGTAWRERSLREAAEKAGVSPNALQLALKQQGIDALPEDRLDAIATKNGIALRVLLDHIERISEKR